MTVVRRHRALVAEGARTGAELLSYTVPPIAMPEVSDTMVAVPYLMRRLTREANRQATERMQQREAKARLKAGLPPIDSSKPPKNLHDLLEWLKHPESGNTSGT